MNIFLENENLKLEISDFGAEIQSIFNKRNNKNYLWNGDKEFWGRRSPVLFPFVGALKNKEYVYDGKKYSMGQHGFARDMKFSLIENTENTAVYELKANENTIDKYPFKFDLIIKYELNENNIEVKWIVQNTDNKEMYFSIGAHPAFLVPVEFREECFIKFDNTGILKNTGLENGLANENNQINGEILTDDGYLKIDKNLFKYDALIFENNQVRSVSLCTPDKEAYVSVKFTSPLVGIWSPYKENCPFICIEPWYGRCDSKDFIGDLQDRKWQNKLKNGEKFEEKYEIEIK